MFFLLNEELVEICIFEKTFETEPSILHFSTLEDGRIPRTINPLSIPLFWLLELFILSTRKSRQMCQKYLHKKQ